MFTRDNLCWGRMLQGRHRVRNRKCALVPGIVLSLVTDKAASRR
jgi:hypothetical protein